MNQETDIDFIAVEQRNSEQKRKSDLGKRLKKYYLLYLIFLPFAVGYIIFCFKVIYSLRLNWVSVNCSFAIFPQCHFPYHNSVDY